MLVYSTITVVCISVVAVPWMTVANSEKCQNATELQDPSVCNVSNTPGQCYWIIVPNDNVSDNWKLITEDGLKLSVTMIFDVPVNTTAVLQSTLLCGKESDNIENMYSIQFIYTLSEPDACKLSVALRTVEESTERLIWCEEAHDPSVNIPFRIPDTNFKLMFKVEKLKPGFCKRTIGNIRFTLAANQPPISPVSGSTSSPLALSSSSPYAHVTDNGGFSGSGLSRGGIAGIVISLIVVVAVIVVAFFFLRRRTVSGKTPFQRFFARMRNAIQTSSRSASDTHASAPTNRPIIDGPYPEITSKSGQLPKTKDYYSVPSDSLHGNNQRPKPGQGTHYAVPDVPESSSYYSIPRDKYDATGVPGGGKINPGFVAEDDGGYSTPDDIDQLEINGQKSNTTQKARGSKQCAAGDSYNKISFHPPHAGSSRKAADTCHHINPLEHAYTDTVNSTGVGMHKGVQDDDKEYKLPRSDHAEYSLATDPGDPYDRPPTTPTGKTQNTDLTGKRGAPRANNTDYNHLKLKDGGSPPAGATRKGKGQGVYNHLEGQVQIDNYNRVDFDGRGEDKQTGDSGGPYNHLGD